MSYFSLRSTLYTLNYHSSRLFGIIIDVFNLDSIIYIHAHCCPVIFHGRAIAMKFHWKPIYAITECYYVVFSLRSTLYRLNYHSSRLFGIIIDVFNLDSIIYLHAHCPVIFHGRAIAMKFHWKPIIYAITECYYVVFFTKVYIIHTKLPF